MCPVQDGDWCIDNFDILEVRYTHRNDETQFLGLNVSEALSFSCQQSFLEGNVLIYSKK